MKTAATLVALATSIHGLRPALPRRAARSARAAPRMAISALLFDCDGVIADTEPDGHRPAFNAAFKEKGFADDWSVDKYGQLLETGGGKERMTAHWDAAGWPAGYAGGSERSMGASAAAFGSHRAMGGVGNPNFGDARLEKASWTERAAAGASRPPHDADDGRPGRRRAVVRRGGAARAAGARRGRAAAAAARVVARHAARGVAAAAALRAPGRRRVVAAPARGRRRRHRLGAAPAAPAARAGARPRSERQSRPRATAAAVAPREARVARGRHALRERREHGGHRSAGEPAHA